MAHSRFVSVSSVGRMICSLSIGFCAFAVLEVYNSWCGPCKPCKELCKRLYFDNADKGLKFYTIDSAVLGKTAQYAGKPHSGSCKPLFIFYKDGAEEEGKRIEGVNYPELLDHVNHLLDA